MNRNDWLHAFYDALSVPHTNRNAWAGVSWIQAEGGTALWNPLNTTQRMPGSWNYNSVGVQNYVSFEQGLEATVKTILQARTSLGYYLILERLRASARPSSTLRAVEKSQWGTGGLALKVLPYVRSDYWKYAGTKISGSA